MGLFFYTQIQVEPSQNKEEKPKITPVTDFFDPDTISRGRLFPDGSMIILLKDGHMEEREVDYISKNGVRGTRKENQWVQGEVRLMPNDAARLRSITEVFTGAEIEERWMRDPEAHTPGNFPAGGEDAAGAELLGEEQDSLIVTPEQAQAEEK